MPSVESITLTIPRGSLGVEIEPSEDGSGVLVAERRRGMPSDSPLMVGDVITSGECTGNQGVFLSREIVQMLKPSLLSLSYFFSISLNPKQQ